MLLGQLDIGGILEGHRGLIEGLNGVGQLDVDRQLGHGRGFRDAATAAGTLGPTILGDCRDGGCGNLNRRRVDRRLLVRGLGHSTTVLSRHSRLGTRAARAVLLGGRLLVLSRCLVTLVRRCGSDRAQRFLGALMLGVILDAACLGLLLLLFRRLGGLRGVVGPGGLHRVVVNDEAAALAGLTRGGERLDEALAHALAGHLHQAQRRDLSDLVARTVASQALD